MFSSYNVLRCSLPNSLFCYSFFLSEQFDETAVTVGLIILLFKCAFVQLLQTEGTDKMLRVELAMHGGYTTARDRLLTTVTQRPPTRVVVHLTVGHTFVLEEAAVLERLVAFLWKKD